MHREPAATEQEGRLARSSPHQGGAPSPSPGSRAMLSKVCSWGALSSSSYSGNSGSEAGRCPGEVLEQQPQRPTDRKSVV